MKQKRQSAKEAPSRLQRDLTPRVLDLIRADGLARGDRLTEIALAQRLQVSRTPVRAVLDQLAGRGILERRPRRGFVLKNSSKAHAAADPHAVSDIDRFCVQIARDRMAERLPVEVSEADLMRRYGVTRPFLLRVLSKLTEVALVERKPGHGWLFSQAYENPKARAESYAFRMLIEPAGILSPDFTLAPGWVAAMRERHQTMLAMRWHETLSIALFEMNAAFHEGLAAASGNRYMLLAVQQQTRLRRFSNYEWSFGYERVVVSCTEHIEILDRLERGERDVAAALMRRHLERAYAVRPVTGVQS